MSAEAKRKIIRIEGIVQGVGFRPFVYRLASAQNLNGWVLNDSEGVLIEIEGSGKILDAFVDDLSTKLPPLASISRMQVDELPLTHESGFAIAFSQQSVVQTAQISPDTHVCPDCLDELFDRHDRRYRFPFINCTNCGPRYSIVTGVPYDRPLTTMVDFAMCDSCQKEYEDPVSRRFHAQPNACVDCGPVLSLHDQQGARIETDDPLAEAIVALQRGEVVAVKGLGGFHLVVNPQNPEAVARLRQRKFRDEKPFALMTPDLRSARSFVEISGIEERLLESIERPIVLLKQKAEQQLICNLTAPHNRYFGVMLPYTPLHHLLLQSFPALIMTSGNQSDEPIVYNDAEAFSHLKGIADIYLCHNRRIHVRTDDSIIRVLAGNPLMMRRSRGYVPRAIKLPGSQPPVLAVGAELKNTICLTSGDRATLSHHIGDLKNQSVLDSLQQSVEHLQHLLGTHPQLVAHDLHPDYLSTTVALRMAGLPKLAVQHHHAHLASCLADNGRDERVIGVIFDGTGYGNDGHIWGGEFLVGDFSGFERVGHLAELSMPGGDAATREPWRMMLSLLYFTFGNNLPELPIISQIPVGDRKLLLQMIEKGLNSPLTSSCGRLFDAISALAGLRQVVNYEGQAALELEMCINDEPGGKAYSFALQEVADKILIDPRPMVRELVDDLLQNRSAGFVSARFHDGLAETVMQVCIRIVERYGRLPVVLSGGVFQNVYLTEQISKLLNDAGFEVLLHRQVPPNDGGLALGQAAIGGRFLQS